MRGGNSRSEIWFQDEASCAIPELNPSGSTCAPMALIDQPTRLPSCWGKFSSSHSPPASIGESAIGMLNAYRSALLSAHGNVDGQAHAHIRAIKDFAGFLKRSPDTATPDDLANAYQLHMADTEVPPTFARRTRFQAMKRVIPHATPFISTSISRSTSPERHPVRLC